MFHSNFTEEFGRYREKILANDSNKCYLFGYGSMLWKVDFEYKTKHFGYVTHYQRHFWLLSDDHRGTPEKMGRVATLVKTKQEDRVYGMIYEIDREKMDKTFEHLNFREKCGYSLNEVVFYPLDKSINNGQSVDCVCYFANEENPYYSPENDLSLVSYQIYKTRGPSGENREYLYNLCKSLRELASGHFKADNESIEYLLKHDKHLFELESLVYELDSKSENDRRDLKLRKI